MTGSLERVLGAFLADPAASRYGYQLTGEGIRVARLELAQPSARRRRAPARPGRPAPESPG
jgi:hypothetical protein